MEYSKLVAVSGLPGLYELISSKNDGAIVRSLVDKTTKFASARIHQFSHLESIEIYTIRENVNLVDIFKAMDTGETALPDARDDKAVKAYFQKVYPDMDFDRVYVSDMKKMVKWFDILKANGVTMELSQDAESEAAEEEPAAETVTEEKAPAKKASRKKAAEETPASDAPKAKAAAKTTRSTKAAAKKSSKDQ